MGELLFNGYVVSVWESKKVLEMDGGVAMVAKQCEYISSHWIVCLKIVKMVNFYVMYILPQF